MSSIRFRPSVVAISLAFGALSLPLAFAQQQGSSTSSTSVPETSATTTDTAAPAQKKLFPPELGETPEQRKSRLGTQGDPGPDPDPKTGWIRYGKEYRIEKYPRQRAAFDQQAGWVRPMANVNIAGEIYRQDEEYVWVWLGVNKPMNKEEQAQVLDPKSREVYREYSPEQLKLVEAVKPEFQILTPASSDRTLTFRDSSDGLPKVGSWRNGLSVADMDEDGKPDLVVPPQRGGAGSTTPYIFLGDGAGHWTLWKGVKWPVSTNYGTVVTGDLNHDGHQDIALAIHLRGLKVFLGDGKGNFRNSSEGLPDDFPTRRALLADVNGDGSLDIVTISEGATPDEHKAVRGSYFRAYLNDGKAGVWKLLDIASPKYQLGGDWLTTGNFNDDKRPDFAGSSIFFNSPDIIYLSDRKSKNQWIPLGRTFLPFYSYYWASTTGKFVSRDHDDLIVSYGRSWPNGMNPNVLAPPAVTRILGLDLVRFNGSKPPTRTPITRWESRRAVWGMASGDFDGDGNLDVIYRRSDPKELVVLLGDGKGTFRRATLKGLTSENHTLYDIKVADVNGDGRPDVIVMYESGGMDKDGSIHVFLNEGSGERAAK
jgi:hypothetical protein